MRVLIAPLALAFAACLIPPRIDLQSPEAVSQETRRYEQDAAHVQRATAAALKVLGYGIVVDEPGRIRTAPKVAVVQAVGTAYRATAVETSVGWEVQLTAAGGGTSVRAIPHGYSGGQENSGSWDKAFFESSLKTLFHEVDDRMGMKTEERQHSEESATADASAPLPKLPAKTKKSRAHATQDPPR